jgi:NitT/TauT family transport system substrate-binding protein
MRPFRAIPQQEDRSMTQTRTTTTTRRAVLAGGAALLATPWVARAQALRRVRYLTPFGFIMGFSEVLYGQTGGFFAKQGLDVEVEGGRGSAMAVQQVTAGNVLLSRTGGTDLIKAYAKEPSIVSIGDIYQRDIFSVISHADKPIRTPEDMAGKTIGLVSTGGATENLLDMMLAARDVPKTAVKRETTGNSPAALEFIKRGRVDAFIATSDTAFQLQLDKQPVLAWSTDTIALAPGQVYLTSKATLEKDPEGLARFLRGVQAALDSIVASKDNLAPVLASMATKFEIAEARRPDKGAAVLAYGVENTFSAPQRDKLATNPQSWDSAYKLMVKAGIIPELSDRNFYDDRARKLAFG